MISDFGLSKGVDDGVMDTACGTPGYVGKSTNFLSTCGGWETYRQINNFYILMNVDMISKESVLSACYIT